MTLTNKLILSCILCLNLALALAAGLLHFFGGEYWLLAPILISLLVWKLAHWLTKELSHTLQALELGLLNIKDNEFNLQLPELKDGQLSRLSWLFNQATQSIRKERQYIYQRELLLDKVIQNSPNIMLLLDEQQRVVYTNHAARMLFNDGKNIIGLTLSSLGKQLDSEFRNILYGQQDGLFSFGKQTPQSWYFSRGEFSLNGQQHQLVLLKQMTQELTRQEVAVWKKAIRIISHELNNSLAPIISMSNSGQQLTEKLGDPKLNLIFETIKQRSAHLSQFVHDYGRFAKLALPKRAAFNWQQLVNHLQQHYPFQLVEPVPDNPGFFDRVQLEQVLLNLLKNAHESHSATEHISVSIKENQTDNNQVWLFITIEDRGQGMSAEVLNNALLPFYSTKQAGTGLGLPLCREIIEAHGGKINLHNRHQGGLSVSLSLPVIGILGQKDKINLNRANKQKAQQT